MLIVSIGSSIFLGITGNGDAEKCWEAGPSAILGLVGRASTGTIVSTNGLSEYLDFLISVSSKAVHTIQLAGGFGRIVLGFSSNGWTWENHNNTRAIMIGLGEMWMSVCCPVAKTHHHRSRS